MNCLDCGKQLKGSKTGRCSPCANRHLASDPEFRAKQKAGLERKWADPAYRAKMSAKAKAHARRMAADETIQQRRREAGKKTIARLFEPEIRAKCLKAVREKSGKTQSANKIAWCPPEYRQLYWFMRKTKRLSLAECKAIIAAEVRRDIARLSPFERQERALKNGARLVANDIKPSLANPGYREERRVG